MRLLDEALKYAAAGIPVFPLHWVKQDGNCSCRQGALCSAKGKHPRIKNWNEVATTDAAKIKEWWENPLLYHHFFDQPHKRRIRFGLYRLSDHVSLERCVYRHRLCQYSAPAQYHLLCLGFPRQHDLRLVVLVQHHDPDHQRRRGTGVYRQRLRHVLRRKYAPSDHRQRDV